MALIQHVWPWDSQPQEAVRQEYPDRASERLIAHYLGGPNGSLLRDLTGRFDGTPTGTSENVTPSGFGRKFTASGDFINLGSDSAFVPPEMTFVSWVTGPFPNSYNTVYSRRTPSSDFVQFFVTSAGKIAVYLGPTGGTVFYDSTGGTLLSNVEYMIAFTYSSTAGLVGYVNGAVDATAAAKGALRTPSADSLIGRDILNTTTRGWGGSITQIRIYNDALTAEEIRNLAQDRYYDLSSRQIYIPTAAASGLPTLSLSAAVSGSIRATGWRPQVTTV